MGRVNVVQEPDGGGEGCLCLKKKNGGKQKMALAQNHFPIKGQFSTCYPISLDTAIYR
jgi:hypothetical protein